MKMGRTWNKKFKDCESAKSIGNCLNSWHNSGDKKQKTKIAELEQLIKHGEEDEALLLCHEIFVDIVKRDDVLAAAIKRLQQMEG